MDLDRKIILENGQQFVGKAFGDQTNKICELVFNTSMVGYCNLEAFLIHIGTQAMI